MIFWPALKEMLTDGLAVVVYVVILTALVLLMGALLIAFGVVG